MDVHDVAGEVSAGCSRAFPRSARQAFEVASHHTVDHFGMERDIGQYGKVVWRACASFQNACPGATGKDNRLGWHRRLSMDYNVRSSGYNPQQDAQDRPRIIDFPRYSLHWFYLLSI
jgi:hypothetical protein